MPILLKIGLVIFQAILSLLLLSKFGLASSSQDELPYKVVCTEGENVCTVDVATYKGWRTYHAACHVCHAQDAVGSTFAPNLLVRLEGMDREKFMDVVLNGYTGQVGVMPGWKDDPNVQPRVEDLWRYLKARSDGALPTGKPKKLRKVE